MANARIQKKTGKYFQTQGVDDLVMLPKVAEDAVLENIKKRYMNDIIYTNIGPVLISVNPYKLIPITDNDWIERYKGRFRHELDPHIFALAEETYRAMKGERENQCVIISGESGAGKTEAAKLVMKYISAVSGNSEGVEYVKHVIFESNPLLEAFGNAKTLRNNNSSRFGKYFEIQFNDAGDPCGGTITNYLLEKSRVTFQTPGERTYHIFYQLLAGASDAEANALQLYAPEHFYYLNQSQCYTADGIDDIKEYRDTRNAMNIIGISQQNQDTIFKLVAGVLHLGNMSFNEDGKGNAVIRDTNVLDLAANMLGVEAFTLQNAILFRVINTGTAGGRQSTYNVPQNVEQASYARDAVAKEIYSRIFDWLVMQVNIALQKNKSPYKTVIGVLDIFGFEIFQKNGFEQFCINYVNEKLQQFFIELTLKAEQEEYNQEGIKWEPIKYFNNQIVCDLMEGKKPPGIFSVLDDVCFTIHATSKGTDVKFLQKMHGAFSGHLHFRGFDTAFNVKHYAGEVCYDVEGFCDKNKDTLFNDLVEMLQCSSNKFLVGLFPENTKDTKKRPTTAGFKIKSSAQKLMQTLAACTPHYIRCIKPNETKRPLDWDHERVKHQVQYLGLLENVRVRRAGFAYRAEFARFLKRYKKLSRKTWSMRGEWSGAAPDGCVAILQDLHLEAGQYQMGKSKVFIRYPETLFHLEELLERHDYECILKIQRAWKKWKAKKHALELRARAADKLRGQKERQQASLTRQFNGDYIRYEDNFPLQEVVNQGEYMMFADQIIKLNRRSKPERRDFIVTDQALYFVMRKKKQGEVVYHLSRRIPINTIGSISLSTLSDNYIVIHCPSEYDTFFENEKKTEILMVINEAIKNQSGREVTLNFNDNIQYKIKTKDTRGLKFTKNESAASAQLKKQGKNLNILIKTGLDKNTDTAPKNFANRGAQAKARSQAAPLGNSGGGGAARGGVGAARGGAAAGGAAGHQSVNRGGAAAGGGGQVRQSVNRGGAAAGGGAARGGAAAGAGRGGPAGRGAAIPPPGARGPAKGPSKPQAKALYDYDATTNDELTFREGDILTILQKDPAGWWEGELNGQKGWIPANYVQEL